MSPRAPLVLALAFTALAPARAAAQELRFTATVPGGVVATGNTLGLAKGTNENGPGNKDSIGTFLTLDNASVDDQPANPLNPWPLGTTNDWTKNGSSATLALPEAEVIYAELLWGGSYLYGEEDVSALLGTPVMLSAGGMSAQVSPDPATALTIAETAMEGFAVNYYLRSANVTDFVKQAGKGVYEVSGVPATQTTAINSLNAAGWTLVVAYRDEGGATRNVSIFVGGSFVDENTQQDYAVSGFCAPPAGAVEGTLIVSTIEGDANLTGDQLLIAPNVVGPFEGLSGPNNPVDNFFASQLNDATGKLDTQGSSGAVNHDAIMGINVSGGRQGWDVTTVPLSSVKDQLKNSQTAATIRTITTGDSYVPILAAFAIDVNAPDFTGAASSTVDAPEEVSLGDKFMFTATLQNSGDVTAEGITFSLPLEAGLSLVSFTTDSKAGDINGNPVDGAALGSGVDVGDLPSGQARNVVVELEAAAPPQFASYFLKAKWAYGFEVCANEPLVPESFSQSTNVKLKGSTSSSSSTGGMSSSTTTSSSTGGGEGGAGGAGAGGSNTSSGGNDGGVDESGGCSCSAPGRGAAGYASAALGLLGLAGLRLRGRGRRRAR